MSEGESERELLLYLRYSFVYSRKIGYKIYDVLHPKRQKVIRTEIANVMHFTFFSTLTECVMFPVMIEDLAMLKKRVYLTF